MKKRTFRGSPGRARDRVAHASSVPSGASSPGESSSPGDSVTPTDRWPGDLAAWSAAAAAGTDPTSLRAALTESWNRHLRMFQAVADVESAEASDIRSLCTRVLADIASVELEIREHYDATHI